MGTIAGASHSAPPRPPPSSSSPPTTPSIGAARPHQRPLRVGHLETADNAPEHSRDLPV